MEQEAAVRIYQSNLDAVTRAYLDADWDCILIHLGIPARLKLADTSVAVETGEDLVILLREQRDSLLRMGMTDYHRLCTEARFTNAARTSIVGNHQTHILRGATYLMQPYTVSMPLEWREETGWQAFGLTAATLRNRDYSLITPRALADMRGPVQTPIPETDPD